MKKTFLLSVLFAMADILYAQRVPMELGAEAGAGRMSNLRDLEGKGSAIASLRVHGKIPLWLNRISLVPAASFEYAMRSGNSSSSQSELHLSHGSFAGMSASLETGIAVVGPFTVFMGAGYGSRWKIQESSYWDIQPQGGFPTLFPDKVRLFPTYLKLEQQTRKLNIQYRCYFMVENRRLNPEGFSWKLNTVALGVSLNWLSTPRKTYFKGTHRTLQIDDVWRAP